MKLTRIETYEGFKPWLFTEIFLWGRNQKGMTIASRKRALFSGRFGKAFGKGFGLIAGWGAGWGASDQGAAAAGVVPRHPAEAPPPVDGAAWFPSEDVALLSIDMPKMKPAQRRAAVAFAVEEFIAQPLEEVHVALGPELAAGQWLVAVVSAKAMQAHAAQHRTAQHRAVMRLLPDVFALPVPETGWSIWAAQSRILVRQADGTGFATDAAALPAFWLAADKPRVTLCGGHLPDTVPVTEHAPLPEGIGPSLAGFTLLTGRYAPKGQGIPKGLVPVASLLAVTVLGHLALQIVEVRALQGIADAREAVLRDLLRQPPGTNLEVALAQAMAASAPASGAGLLPLIAEVFSVIAPAAGRVSLQDLRYSQTDRAALMTLDAPDLTTLQRLEADLVAAGFRVTTGAATTNDGNARVQMTLQRDGV